MRWSRAFSSATTACAASDAAASTWSASKVGAVITSDPKSDAPARSGKAMRSPGASGSPIRTSSPSRPSTSPPSAPVASTAVSTITCSSWVESWVATSASPNRAAASRTRVRSVSSSTSRCWSCAAMSLKALARSANSSRPRTSTRSLEVAAREGIGGVGEAAERPHDRASEQIRDDRDQRQRAGQHEQDAALGPACGGIDRGLRARARRSARPLGWVNGEVASARKEHGRDLHGRRPVGECRERLPAAAAGDHAAAAGRDELVLG